MKIVERANYNMYRFTCNACKNTLEATGKEFEFFKPGRLICTCCACGERVMVKERSITIVPVYQEVKNKKQSKE